MFGLFNKKPSLNDMVKKCIALAKTAHVQVVLEKGLYSGFIVTLDTNLLATTLAYQEALHAFVGEIENRITCGNFDDPSKDLWGDPLLNSLRESSSRGSTKGLPRVVVSLKGEMVFKW